MLVTSFYRPPSSNEDYLNSFIEEITILRRSHETSYFYVGGDFNLPDIDWNTSLIRGTSYPTKLNEAIIRVRRFTQKDPKEPKRNPKGPKRTQMEPKRTQMEPKRKEIYAT